MKYKLILTVLISVVLMMIWLYGNVLIHREITMAHEYLGRGLGLAIACHQDTNKSYVISYRDIELPGIGKFESPWCDYILVLKEGVRLKECNKDEVVAALIPNKCLPFWYVGKTLPPAIVLHGSLASYKTQVNEVPLKL